MIETEKRFNSIDNFLQITEWLPPNAISETQYGFISNLEWVAFEQERIGNCHVVYSNLLRRVCLKWDESEYEKRKEQTVSLANTVKGKRGES